MTWKHSISSDILKQYRNYLFESEYSERTIEKYMHDINVFLKQMPDSKNVTKEQIIQWKTSMLHEGLAVSTINSMLAAVNGLTRFLSWTDLYVKPLKQQRKIFRDKRKELSHEEYIRLLKTAKRKTNIGYYLSWRRFVLLESECQSYSTLQLRP